MGWPSRRFRDHSSSTLCELYALLDAVSLVCQRGVNAAIKFCDFKPAVQSLSDVQPTHPQVDEQILSFLSLMNARKACVKFVWVPSHVDLCHNATADHIAKEICRLPPRGDERPLSLPCYLSRLRPAAFLLSRRRREAKTPHSITINHYESVCRHKNSYRRQGLMGRRHTPAFLNVRVSK